jgi:23S rRNA pseudouridine1911/1915/1917 synthase
MGLFDLFEEQTDVTTIHISVPPQQRPERIDRYLTEAIADISRAKVQLLLQRKLITKNGSADIRPSDKVKANDFIIVEIPRPRPLKVEGEPISLDIIYEDDDIIAINKPAGMVVHPAVGNRTGTLVNALANYCTTLSTINGIYRPGIVHRLDKETSGLIIAAKNDIAHNAMARKFEYRKIRKFYMTLVWGTLKQNEGQIVKNIGRNPKDRKSFAALEKQGKHAETHYWVEAAFPILSLLKVQILTGRTHQIRVHLADAGHPVLGDSQYGGRTKKLKSLPPVQKKLATAILEIMPRQALHSFQMEFDHPVSREPITLQAPLPQDMQNVIQLLKKEFHIENPFSKP